MLKIAALGFWCAVACYGQSAQVWSTGSKAFTESVVLGEILSGVLRSQGLKTRHRAELGGTQIVWKALLRRDIDLYVEYTGTLQEELLAGESDGSLAGLRAALAKRDLRMSEPLGFNNTYAIGMKEATAARYGIRRVSDLARHPELKLGFSHEFLDRHVGWPSVRATYEMETAQVRGLDHDLAYRALDAGEIDVTDLYSTDAEIQYYGLRTLEDDRGVFPKYFAVILYRAELESVHPQAAAALRSLEGRLPEKKMIELNAAAKVAKVSERQVASDFIATLGVPTPKRAPISAQSRLLSDTRNHLRLVCWSLLATILVALPLGILAAKLPRFGEVILAATGVVQTIPSLALLVFMIPFLGIGARPAFVALFLYGLLPIVRNTCTGIREIPKGILESADALGLPRWARLWRVELPIASRTILAGIKTAAVINVGTATLGAIIGAGGYGEPILIGIRRDDVNMILQGAIPAAVLALLVQGVFAVADRWFVPRGLRVR